MKVFLIGLLILMSESSLAYNTDLYGARPFISITKNMDERWDLNIFYSETLNLVNAERDGVQYPSKDLQSYFQTGASYRFNPNLNFSFGYVFQRNNPFDETYANENRLWQQVVFQYPSELPLTHRFRLEERSIQDATTHTTQDLRTRLRYQIMHTHAFTGNTILNNSYYYSVYNEFYFSLTGDKNAFYSENWSYFGVGYQTLGLGRIEVGPLIQVAVTNRNLDTRTLALLQFGWTYNF